MQRLSPAATYLGMCAGHSARLLHGLIVAKWNRFGIIWNQIFPDGMPKQSTTKRKGKRRWRELGCSHPWCRGRMDGQSASSPSGLIPSTIPKGISDGVSRCSLTPASDASGSRPVPAVSRPRRSIGCSLIISKSFAMAAHPSTQPTVNAFAVYITPARRCKSGWRGWEQEEGGRGFISSGRGRSATAPHAMRRFFSWAQSFELFSGNQRIQTANPQFAQANQWCSARWAPPCGIYFLDTSESHPASEKVSRNSRGGGGVRHESLR
jgi:hypothetical protein